jgi:hypothetical protein
MKITGESLEDVRNKLISLKNIGYITLSNGQTHSIPQLYDNLIKSTYSLGDVNLYHNINHFSGKILNLNLNFRQSIVTHLLQNGFSTEEILCRPDSLLINLSNDKHCIKILYLSEYLNNKLSYNLFCMGKTLK